MKKIMIIITSQILPTFKAKDKPNQQKTFNQLLTKLINANWID
jgi:hypothetical protein